ncbi:hypothetical protein [Thalassoroseus pseudoceratinae]|uniref:hypothetical protein n=1 Tax=Thalassoroseus pseudoceratinae TaxID=2713176 RepID=UPI00141E0B2D|nr:hypothetical protein [Thalassoroseus pseudoceratinae]
MSSSEDPSASSMVHTRLKGKGTDMLSEDRAIKNQRAMFVYAGCLLLLVGCGGGDEPYRKPTAPVTGIITIDGQPPKNPVKITTHPVDGMDQEHPSFSHCMTGENGAFEISTYETGDGVPEGEYRLTFQAGQMNLVSRSYSGDLFKGRYSDPEKSEFTLTVSGTDPIDLGTINLSTSGQ